MMEIAQGIVLGAVQGLTEFLPISSSGHLILVPSVLGWPDQGQAFDVVLHLATLLAVLGFYSREIWSIFVKRNWLFVGKVIVAALPALLFAYLLKDWLEVYTRNTTLIAIDLIIWGIALWWVDRKALSGKELQSITEVDISWMQVLAVAFAQPLALLPGTSRSGITITAALASGMTRQQAASFSFFVSMPIMAAAGGYGLLELSQTGIIGSEPKLIAGFIAALLTGGVAIRVLLRYVSKDSYAPFVYYRIALAIIVLFFA